MALSKPVRIVGYIVTFFGAAVLGNALYSWYQTTTPAAKAARQMEGQPRPVFNLPDLEGDMRSASEWDGKVLVVNFWATWCPPCRREIPAFMDMQDKYGAQGLQFVGVALDNTTKVQDYVNTMGIDYPTLVGGEQAVETSKRYGNTLGALPYTAIIDRQGRIVHTHRGEVSKETAEKEIKALL